MLTGIIYLALSINLSLASADEVGPYGEVATTDFSIAPLKGSLYTKSFVSSEWSVSADISQPGVVPAPVVPISPMKEVDLKLTKDLTFNPNKNMPVCPDNKVGPTANLSVPPNTIIDRCPKSVIGNGSAQLYLAHMNTGTGPTLKDPVLIIFNGGYVSSGPLKGRPKIKIYGFSKGTGAGIYMGAVLTSEGVLKVQVPVLTADSAVANFHFNIPGKTPIIYDYKSIPRSVGQDLNFIKAKCSAGSWALDSSYKLGTRNDLGEDTGPTSVIDAPRITHDCSAIPGYIPFAKLGNTTVKGASKTKRNNKILYRIKVKNTGTAVAKRVKVTISGRGVKGKKVFNLENIKAKGFKNLRAPLRFTKTGKVKVIFRTHSSNAGSKMTSRNVFVRR